MVIVNRQKQKIKLKIGDTFFPKSNKVPCNLACAKMANKGIMVVVIINPRVTNHQSSPDLKPSNGGNIKFPAPKNPANKAKPNTKVSLVLFIV
ncbi:hypothetical protein GCM10023314_17160 [Algibacter agarivorans]|uniref:Uncharacterized protein n=1 Tax=Algibacter agarivorans TaxID=1109741 RepID=A0ABP9GQ49_9FLAO